jgi:hypothetical protein
MIAFDRLEYVIDFTSGIMSVGFSTEPNVTSHRLIPDFCFSQRVISAASDEAGNIQVNRQTNIKMFGAQAGHGHRRISIAVPVGIGIPL